MRSGKLGLVGAVLAALVIGAAGCERTRGSSEAGDVDTGTRAESESMAPAPNVGVSGGSAAGADTAASADSGSRTGTAATPPLNARPDSSRVSPGRDTSGSGPVPPAQAARRDTTRTATRSPGTTPRAGTDTATRDPGTATAAAGGNVATRAGTPSKTVTQLEYTGWKQYEVNCARCHGEYGLGSTIAPSLYHSFQSGAVDSAEYQRVVHGSRAAKGMPNWQGMLSEEYLHAIYKYLEGRGAGRIAAGRPTPQG